VDRQEAAFVIMSVEQRELIPSSSTWSELDSQI
jgi:hypothetical protein